MVSPRFVRNGGKSVFANLHEVDSRNKQNTEDNPTEPPLVRRKIGKKYEAPMYEDTKSGEKHRNGGDKAQKTTMGIMSGEEDEKKRLKRLEVQVRQALIPFVNGGVGQKSSIPAAATIKKFLTHASEQKRKNEGVITASEFRKCLFALGLASEDCAFLLDQLDRTGTGVIDARFFSTKFLPNAGNGTTTRTFDDENNKNTKTLIHQNGFASNNSRNLGVSGDRDVKELHRKVIERVLLRSKNQNLKDTFRQYDLDRTGLLTLPQFRTMMRDHGFVGADVELLIKYLDRNSQQAVSFNAFMAGVKLGSEQGYIKHSPKKQQLALPLGAAKGGKASGVKSSPTHLPEDPMEMIRGKLRQRVMGHNKTIREVFMEFDLDNSGSLDYEEFKRFMAKYNFTAEETSMVVEYLDRDFSGTIDYDEFAAGLLFYRPPPAALPQSIQLSIARSDKPSPPKNAIADGEQILYEVQDKLNKHLQKLKENNGQRVNLREEFAKYDVDGTNSLDYQEFGAFLVSMGIKLRAAEITLLIESIDTDGSESINFDEFIKLFCQHDATVDESTSECSDDDHQSSSDQEDRELLAVFNKYNADKSGYLDYDELRQLMRDHDFSEAEVAQVIKQIDQDGINHENKRDLKTKGRRRVDYETFASVVSNKKWKMKITRKEDMSSLTNQAQSKISSLEGQLAQWMKRVLRNHRSVEEAFYQHDTDGSRELDHGEFRRFMKHYGMKRDEDINALINQLDSDGNGLISYSEFAHLFGNGRQKSSARKTQQVSYEQNEFQKSKLNRKKSNEDAKGTLTLLRMDELLFMEQVLRSHDSMEAAFREYDQDQRNELDYEQFREFMGEYGLSDESKISLLLRRLDTNNSGSVDIDEFLSVFNEQRLAQYQKQETGSKNHNSGEISEKRMRTVRLRQLEEHWISEVLASHHTIRDVFCQYSRDQNGELTLQEFTALMNAFGIDDPKDISLLVKRLDVDQSGCIDYDEFSMIFHESRVKQLDKGQPSAFPDPRPSRQSIVPAVSQAESKKARAARMRELEVKWMKRVLSCHSSIETAFRDYDKNGNGELDHEEFRYFMKRYGIGQEDDINFLIRRLDLNGSGTIDFDEFSTVFNPLRINQDKHSGKLNGIFSTMPDDDSMDADELEAILEIERELATRMLEKTRDLRQAFHKFDLNGNGRLEYKEFRAVLKSYRLPEMEIRKVIRHLDRDVSGFIDYKKFIAGFSIAKEGGSSSPGGERKQSRYKVSRVSQAPINRKRMLNKVSESTPGISDRHPDEQIANDTAIETVKKQLLTNILATYGTVQSVFRRYDEGKQGRLTEAQFEALVLDHGVSKADAAMLLDIFDQDQSGTIEYGEFLSQLVVRAGV